MSYTPSFALSTILIDPAECVGNSLSTINNNFTLLDYKLANLALSADAYWNSLYTVTTETSASWTDVITVVRENSGAWNSAYTAMTSHSACWLKPITLIFPNVVDTENLDLYVHLQSVSSWLNENFPVTSIIGSEVAANYCAGQELFVYTMGFDTENQTIVPDSRNLRAVCNARNLSWSWMHCAIKAGCAYNVGYIANAGTDYDLVGNPADDGGTQINPGGSISFTLDGSIADIQTLNTSIINYRPSIFNEGYLIFKNNTGNSWSYTSTRSLSS